MAAQQADQWYENVETELARRTGGTHLLTSWGRGVPERLLSAGFSPAEAVNELLRNLPAESDAVA